LRKPHNGSVLCGFGDFSEGSVYSWDLNGGSVGSGNSEQLFLAHFDNSLTAENGETPIDQSGFNGYSSGKFGSGIDGVVEYSAINNFDLISGEPSYTFGAKGYLGEPAGEIIQLDLDEQVFRKRFDNGIVIISNGADRADYELGKYYREISGVQDPEANSGELVNVVNLNRTDGRILLLPLCSNNPNGDGDCISEDGGGDGGGGSGGGDGGSDGGGIPGDGGSEDGQNSTSDEEIEQEGGTEYPAIIGELFERGNSTVPILITILVSVGVSVYFSLLLLRKKKSFKRN